MEYTHLSFYVAGFFCSVVSFFSAGFYSTADFLGAAVFLPTKVFFCCFRNFFQDFIQVS